MKQYSEELDAQDLAILRALQAETLSNVELARRVNLSAPATHARVKRLETLGYIRRTVAMLDRERLGFDLLCFITVALQMHKPDEVLKFRETVANAPEVLECHHVTGDYDYILKVALTGRQDLQRFLMDVLTPIPAVARLHTRVVLDEVKSTTELPL
ncbi:MAG: Lrp/AsnC family transcriptional regulator [Chloroflexi bacterium]|nr:Lrp/AsnC family transcriptional regulator [Chloroflexota bacterium]